MPQRGPKPQPTPLRLLEGGRSATATESLEPKPSVPADVPSPPSYLNELASAEWRRIIEDLYATGVYTDIDETTLAAYCTAVGRWRQAEADLQKMADLDSQFHGTMVKTTNGNLIQNPLLGVANKALETVHRLAAEFGMTPSARRGLQGSGRGAVNPLAAKYGLD